MYRKAEILKLVTNNQMDVRSNFVKIIIIIYTIFYGGYFIWQGGHSQRALDGEFPS